uniref:Gypsy retrotransposon integrase-like protein 1 n=1 Tax=Poecilia formosa TaxID=48698 RepID=A0A096MDF0_POEFO
VSPIVVTQRRDGGKPCISNLRGATVFSTIDLASAYHQMPLHPESRDITAFITNDGLFRFCRVPFGLASVPSAFQKMSIILAGLPGVQAYLDDIICYSSTQKLKLNMHKCKFNQPSLNGHTISKDGLQPDQDKVTAVIHAPAPHDTSSLRSFLGLASWYSKFIPDFATVIEPLRAVLRDSTDLSFEWTTEAHSSFTSFKDLIVNSPALALYDPELPTYIQIKMRELSLLHQELFFSAERKYSTVEREALACVWAVSSLLPVKSVQNFHYCATRLKKVGPNVKKVFQRTLLHTFRYNRLRELFWWPQLDKFVHSVIASCVNCQFSDKVVITAPWDCRYAIVFTDYYSKWPEVAFSSTVTTDVIRFLATVLSREGNPMYLVSDNGCQFTSHAFSTFQHLKSSVYYPKANGVVKRFNRVLKECIQTCERSHSSWKQMYIEVFSFTFNSTPHLSTGYSPYFLAHGREPRLPANVHISSPKVSDCPQNYGSELATRMDAAFETVLLHHEEQKQKREYYYNKDTQFRPYACGDLVWIDDPTTQRQKLSPNWTGPFKVVSVD